MSARGVVNLVPALMLLHSFLKTSLIIMPAGVLNEIKKKKTIAGGNFPLKFHQSVEVSFSHCVLTLPLPSTSACQL